MIPTEHDEQVALMKWAEHKSRLLPELGLLFANANGGKRHMSVAKRLKAEGVKPGVPDLFLPVARHGYHGLFIEMKRKTNSRSSKEQQQWSRWLTYQGYAVATVKGCEWAIAALEEYLEVA